ncbi:MAG: hypothetical protein MCSN_2910 [Candidatus Microsyncoccus archaeolyticus]|nr:MAG: hypothetical protein MCSN_2910 [Candidatus Parcubacteria bacterium]
MTIPFPVYFLVPSAFMIIIVGFYSWFKVDKRENLLFFLLSVAQSIWAISTFMMWYNCDVDELVLFWDKVLYIASVFMIPFLYHFSIELCDLKTKRNKILLFLCYLFSLGFVYLIVNTDYFIKDLFRYDWGCHTVAQIGHHFYLIYLGIFLSLTFYNFYSTWKNEEEPKEKRVKSFYILLAFFIFSLSGLGLLSAYKISIYPLYYLALPLCALIITYAITEKNLFPSVVATDILVVIILILLVTFFIFPDLEFNILIKGLIFILILSLSLLLIKHNHEELERRQELERMSRLKSEFISIVSHQLRTPLAAIRGHSSMIKDGDYGEISQDILNANKYIYDSSVRMIKLVNSLLSVSRLERGRIELNIESISIEKVIEECVEDVSMSAKEKGLYIKYKKSPKKLPEINGDFEKIKNAVCNIINNAVLYTVKGGVTIKSYLENNSIKIEIKDTGVGIDKEDLGKIFESFSRGKGGLELYTQGTGLGLYVAKSFVEIHNGTITAFSKGKNKGSIFIIDLPIKSIIKKHQTFNIIS